MIRQHGGLYIAKKKRYFFVGMCFFLLNIEAAAGHLSLSAYLAQVKQRSEVIIASKYALDGYVLRNREADLITSPQAFTDVEFQSYNSVPDPFGLSKKSLNAIQNQTYQAGIEKKTDFGPQGKIYYNYQTSNLGAWFPQGNFSNSSPVLEASLPILRNWLGHEVRNEKDMIRARNQFQKYVALNEINHVLMEAEVAYWQLVITRRMIVIQRQSLHRAQTFVNWITDRVSSHLAEQNDLLEANANVATYQLRLQEGLEREEIAASYFNLFRNSVGHNVPETLNSGVLHKKPKNENKTKPSDRHVPLSYEVLASLADKNSQIAQSQLKNESLKPNLDLYVRYSVNPENPFMNQFITSSFATNYPNTSVGLHFSMPLDGITKQVQQGYLIGAQKAKTDYLQKFHENCQKWQNYQALYKRIETRAMLAKQLSHIQREKMMSEKSRYKLGKTTTYHVILAQQDYETARLKELDVAFEHLKLGAQLKHLWDIK